MLIHANQKPFGDSDTSLLGKTDQKGADCCCRARWPQANEDYMINIPIEPVPCTSAVKYLPSAGTMNSE